MPEDFKPSDEMQVSEISNEEDIPIPAPSSAPTMGAPSAEIPSMPSPQTMSFDEIQSIVEEIIDEKWRGLLSSIGDIATWKMQMTEDLEATKQEILRMQSRFDSLQSALVGKVSESEAAMKAVSTDIKALEKVFEKILEPLTSNIKELSRITDELREKKK